MGSIFIPTSSLNFNNIFSTESISPVCFYHKRGFGYKRFSNVEPNPFQNITIAYGKLPKFFIKESDYENDPIIFEIDKELIESCDFKKTIVNKIDVYVIRQTIYLIPGSVKIHFFNESNLKSCLIRSEPSIETKLVDLYKSSFVITSFEEGFEWDKSILSKIKDKSLKNISKYIFIDQGINRIKGLFYSYLIGVLKSPPHKVVELTHLQISIKSYITQFQEYSNPDISKKLEDKIELLKAYFQSVKYYNNISDLIKLRFSHIYDKKQLEYLKHIRIPESSLYELVASQINEKYLSLHPIVFIVDELIKLIRTKNISKDFLQNELNVLMNSFNNEIHKYIQDFSFQKDISFDSNRLFFANLKLTDIKDSSFQENGAEVFRHIINMLIDFPISNSENFKEMKADIAFEIGKMLKEQLKDWEGSLIQKYINGLLSHVESYESFNLKSYNNYLMQSISAFIMKGDDPEKLLTFLIENKIQNKSIALSFWGSVFGFASLPKTLFNSLFNENNKSLAVESYIYLHRQIHNNDIKPFLFDNKTYIDRKGFSSEQQSKLEFHHVNIAKNTKTIIIDDKNKIPNCPKCGAKMIYREAHNFYGCSNYPTTGCKGSVDSRLTYKGKNKEKDISRLMLKFLEDNKSCKIKEMNEFVKKHNNSFTFNIGQTENYIKEHLIHKMEIYKDGAKMVKLREDGMFPTNNS